MVPKKIGHYEVDRELGPGGMSTVYLARDTNLDIDVAVKVLARQLAVDEQFSARFRREAKIIAALKHPAVVRVYNFGEADEQLYLVMEYMSGGSLRDRLKKHKRFSVSETLRLLEQIGPALQLAHSRGIVHRDLKPENILFDDQDAAYVADFGIAKLVESKSVLTTSGLIGTPAYMSPEQASGESKLDGRSDQYSLAVVLFEALTGRPLFKADTPMKILHAHMSQPPVDIRSLRKGLPAELSAFFSQAFAKDPRNRFASMDEMVSAFHGAVTAGETVKVPPPDPEAPKTKRLEKERDAGKGMQKALAWLVANRLLLTGLAAMVLVLSVLASRQPTDDSRVIQTQNAETELAAAEASTATLAPTVTSAPAATAEPTVTVLPQTISVSNVSQLIEIKGLAFESTLEDIAFSPDGNLLAGVNYRGEVSLWSIDEGNLVEKFGDVSIFYFRPGIDFSPNGELLALGTSRASVWSVSSGELMYFLPGQGQGYSNSRSVAFSPNGTLAVGSYGARIWGDNLNLPLKELAHENFVSDLVFSPQGNILATIEAYGEVKLFKSNDGFVDESILLRAFQAKRDSADCCGEQAVLAFSPAGDILAVTTGEIAVSLWRIEDGELLYDLEGSSNDVAFSPSGELIVTSSADGVAIWRTSDAQLLHTIPVDASCIAFSPDGKLVAICSRSEENVELWGIAQ